MEEIELIFSINNIKEKSIKINIKENQTVDEVLNHYISLDNTLSDIKIINLSCNDNQINRKETFKYNNIKNNDIILIECKKDEEKEEDSEENQGLIIFEFDRLITDKAHVNLKSANLRAIIDRTFDVFKTLKNKYLMVCSSSEDYKKYGLICYDIVEQKIIFKKEDAHSERIFTCIHYTDEYNKRDLLITGSFDKTIKIWVIDDDFKLLYENTPNYNFKENTYLLSECLLFYNNSLYLITSAYEMYSKGYELLYYNIDNTQEFSSLEHSQENVTYLEAYYYDGIPLIISGNYGNIKIFNFKEKKLIKEFSDNDNLNKKFNFSSCKIHRTIDKNWVISSGSDGYLRIWDYDNSSNLIDKINSIEDNYIVGLELINNQILLVGGGEGSIKEYDLKNDMVSDIFNSEKDERKEPLLCLKYIKIDEDNYLFTHSNSGRIELWK